MAGPPDSNPGAYPRYTRWERCSVLADLAIHADSVAIHEWSSRDLGRGNTNLALDALRREHPGRAIVAYGIGRPGSESYAYWAHQRDAGRVDVLVGDDDNEV